MTERGYLDELKSRGGFYPTARLLSVAQAIVDSDPVLTRVEPALQRLMKDTRESVFLAKADGTKRFPCHDSF
jgi:DNA-binding IclR family transcriptional regulator